MIKFKKSIMAREWGKLDAALYYGDTYLFDNNGKTDMLFSNFKKGRMVLRYGEIYNKRSPTKQQLVDLIPDNIYLKDLLRGHKIALEIHKKGLK